MRHQLLFPLFALILFSSCQKESSEDLSNEFNDQARGPVGPARRCLVAWYPFTGNANDASGHGFDGLVQNAVLTTNRFGDPNRAYSFDDNQDIIVPNSANLNIYPISISLWYYADTLIDDMHSNVFSKYEPAAWNGYQIILEDRRSVDNMGTVVNDGFGVPSWYLKSYNDRVIGYYNEPSFLQSNISARVWYHYVFTADNFGGKIYVNGQLIDSHPWSGQPGACSNNFLWKIGGQYHSWFKGKIDDIRVYNCMLTPQEVIRLYQLPG